MSLPISEILESLQRIAKLDPKVLVAIETDLETKEAELAAERAAPGPKSKNQINVLLLDPDKKLADGDEFVAIVTQIAENDDPATIPDRIYRAAYNQNASGKRKKYNIKSLGEIGDIKRKFLRNENVAVKSGKEPVRVIIVNGNIPVA